MGERRLSAGDTLAIYTDGVTESCNNQEEEFGDERLAEVLQRNRELSPNQLLAVVTDEVRRYSPDQQDDITLIVAKSR